MSKTKKESFIFYKSFYDAIENIEDITIKAEAYKAIINYALNGTGPKTNNTTIKIIVAMAKPQILATDKRYYTSVENGKKGGRPKKQKHEENKNLKNNLIENQNNPKKTLNDNYNVNYNDNVNDNKRENIKEISLTQEQLNDFKKMFPNKTINDNQKINEKIDFDLLLKKVQESNFLSTNNNLNFEWILSNYDKIINGDYTDFKKQTSTSIIEQHDYTNDDMDKFFTNIDDIEL